MACGWQGCPHRLDGWSRALVEHAGALACDRARVPAGSARTVWGTGRVTAGVGGAAWLDDRERSGPVQFRLLGPGWRWNGRWSRDGPLGRDDDRVTGTTSGAVIFGGRQLKRCEGAMRRGRGLSRPLPHSWRRGWLSRQNGLAGLVGLKINNGPPAGAAGSVGVGFSSSRSQLAGSVVEARRGLGGSEKT